MNYMNEDSLYNNWNESVSCVFLIMYVLLEQKHKCCFSHSLSIASPRRYITKVIWKFNLWLGVTLVKDKKGEVLHIEEQDFDLQLMYMKGGLRFTFDVYERRDICKASGAGRSSRCSTTPRIPTEPFEKLSCRDPPVEETSFGMKQLQQTNMFRSWLSVDLNEQGLSSKPEETLRSRNTSINKSSFYVIITQ